MRKTSFQSYLLLIAQLAISIVVSTTVQTKPAEAQQNCSASNSPSHGEAPSETYRTVELSNFGVAVAIPENYRTMQLQSGAVKILHPSNFDMIQCVANGGRTGHGYYYEIVELVEDDLTMDLREQATGGYGTSSGGRGFIETQVVPYQKDGLDGYIVTGGMGYGASFLGVVPGRDELIRVSAVCDCQVGIEAVAELLSDITVLN